MDDLSLHAPEPRQDIHSENGNAGSGSDSGQCFLGSGFAMRKAVAADHNCDQRGDLGNRACEEGLESGKPCVKRRAATSLCVGGERQSKK